MDSNTWVRSSRCSADQPQCVEVRRHAPENGDRDVWVKNSTDRDGGPGVLRFTDAEWTTFVEGVKAGEFDL